MASTVLNSLYIYYIITLYFNSMYIYRVIHSPKSFDPFHDGVPSRESQYHNFPGRECGWIDPQLGCSSDWTTWLGNQIKTREMHDVSSRGHDGWRHLAKIEEVATHRLSECNSFNRIHTHRKKKDCRSSDMTIWHPNLSRDRGVHSGQIYRPLYLSTFRRCSWVPSRLHGLGQRVPPWI